MKRTRNTTHAFVAALRDELQHYGGALALLDGDRLSSTEEADDFPHAFDSHSESVKDARAVRLTTQRALALQLKLPELAPFRQIAVRIEANYRPLVVALVEENFHLLLRLRHRGHHEHVRLQRALAGLERVIEIISSQDAPVTSAGDSHHPKTDPHGTGTNLTRN
jgi:hypothetical protein